MTLYIKDDPKLGRVFMRGRMGPPCRCGWVRNFLCDFPVGNGKTCDAGLCEGCAVEAAHEVHYCKGHAEEWKKFVEAGGVNLSNIVPIKVVK